MTKIITTTTLIILLLCTQLGIGTSFCSIKTFNINTKTRKSSSSIIWNNNRIIQNRNEITILYSNNKDNDSIAVSNSNINDKATKMNSSMHNDRKKNKKNPVLSFFLSNWLVLGEVIVIYLAKQNPRFFASGGRLRPEFWVSKVGVFTIFFINGIALSLSGSAEDIKAAGKTNALIQSYNFIFLPLVAKVFTQFYPDPSFRDGLLVLSCLPTTINICVAQTLAAGGDMGTAIFNAIFANVIGVFLTPILTVSLLGSGQGVSLLSTLGKLGNLVVIPLVIGQILRRTPIGTFAQKVTGYSRTLSSCLLLAIVYNVFSDTFVNGLGVEGSALLRLCVAMPTLYVFFSMLFWKLSFKVLPGLDSSTRAAALFCSSQKTLAFGIPFIKAALSHRPDIAYILAPLLMYAPSQLLLGSSVIAPAMKRLINKESNFQDGGGI